MRNACSFTDAFASSNHRAARAGSASRASARCIVEECGVVGTPPRDATTRDDGDDGARGGDDDDDDDDDARARRARARRARPSRARDDATRRFIHRRGDADAARARGVDDARLERARARRSS